MLYWLEGPTTYVLDLNSSCFKLNANKTGFWTIFSTYNSTSSSEPVSLSHIVALRGPSTTLKLQITQPSESCMLKDNAQLSHTLTWRIT